MGITVEAGIVTKVSKALKKRFQNSCVNAYAEIENHVTCKLSLTKYCAIPTITWL